MMFPLKLIVSLGLLCTMACSNIIFHWAQPSCNPGNIHWTGCLSGQTCLPNGTCLTDQDAKILLKRDYSIDGRCGPLNGGLVCDPNSPNYQGTCCSQYSWCGFTDAYCGLGCVADCTTAALTTINMPWTTFVSRVASSTISDVTLAANSEPVLGSPTGISISVTRTSVAVLPTPTMTISSDGTCGIQSGGTVCGDWPLGSCCSMYGWCGNTTGHCGSGCQSGPCASGPIGTAAPGPSPGPTNGNPGTFEVIGQAGVPPMHAALMQNGRVIFLDKVEDYTQLTLPSGYFAYSSEFDPSTAQAVPLAYDTNAFCSGGIFLADGRLINVGGNAPLTFIDPTVGDGFTAIRYLQRSATDASFNGQSWSEPGNKLNTARWYASAQILADGRIFVASGSLDGLNPALTENNNPTYEILSPAGITDGQSIAMDILIKSQPYYMYPFIHLLRDGTIFVFVSRSSELFSVATQTTVRTFDDLPGEYRTYPNTGGSVMLALSYATGWAPDVIVCGGGAYQDITSPTDASCGRIQPLSQNPKWEMDSMPEGRVMVEGTLLPDGLVIWLNGCSQGAQGFGLGANPTLSALIYDPSQPLGQRFTVGASTTIPRLYHSVALLMLDGTILIAGSNPVEQPVLTASPETPYPTEFRVERYTPPYLSGTNAARRPTGITISTLSLTANGTPFTVTFNTPDAASTAVFSVVLHCNGFVTHSLHMGQRALVLDASGWVAGRTAQTLTVLTPPNGNVAPPGPYVLFVLVDGIPGVGQFVHVNVA